MSQCGRKESCTDCEILGPKYGFVKSSAFAPVSLNLMGMYLLKEHMNAHYRRLYNVKAAVDTKAPHSLQTKPSCGRSVVPSRSTTSRSSSRLVLTRSSGSQNCIHHNLECNMKLADKIDRYLESVQKEKPRIPERANTKSARPSYSGHPTEPFVPKTLSRHAKSRLINSRLYHPPVNRSASHSSMHQKELERSKSVNYVETRELALASSRANRLVPALNIQRDLDHMRWLENQARKIKAEERLQELDSFLDKDDFDEFEQSDDNDDGYYYSNDEVQPAVRRKKLSSMEPIVSRNIAHVKPIELARDMDNGQVDSHEQEASSLMWIQKQLEEKEEELKYLEFIRDVTNDIILNGIFTDRILQQVFFFHMNRRTDLDIRKMKKLLDKLQEELGVSKSTSYAWLDMNVLGIDELIPTTDKENFISMHKCSIRNDNHNSIFPGEPHSNRIIRTVAPKISVKDESGTKHVKSMVSSRLETIAYESNSASQPEKDIVEPQRLFEKKEFLISENLEETTIISQGNVSTNRINSLNAVPEKDMYHEPAKDAVDNLTFVKEEMSSSELKNAKLYLNYNQSEEDDIMPVDAKKIVGTKTMAISFSLDVISEKPDPETSDGSIVDMLAFDTDDESVASEVAERYEDEFESSGEIT